MFPRMVPQSPIYPADEDGSYVSLLSPGSRSGISAGTQTSTTDGHPESFTPMYPGESEYNHRGETELPSEEDDASSHESNIDHGGTEPELTKAERLAEKRKMKRFRWVGMSTECVPRRDLS